jgi:Ca2+/Na+ antiporter
MTFLFEWLGARARIIARHAGTAHEIGGADTRNRGCTSAAPKAQIDAMRLLGIASVVLAIATLYALADSDLGAAAYYTLAAFLCAFLGYCWGSIERLREQLEKLERRVARTNESEP